MSNDSLSLTAGEMVHALVQTEDAVDRVGDLGRQRGHESGHGGERRHDEAFTPFGHGLHDPVRHGLLLENRQQQRELGGHALEHAGVDVVRADGERTDVRAGLLQLAAQRAGEADGRELAGRVIGLTGHGHDAGRRGHGDDRRALLFLERRHERLGGPEQAQHVHGEGAADLLLGQVLERRTGDHAGVVDQHVDAAQRLDGLGGGPLHGRVVGHVHGERDGLGVGRVGAHLGVGHVGRGLRRLTVDVPDGHASALLDDAQRHQTPDARARAGDHHTGTRIVLVRFHDRSSFATVPKLCMMPTGTAGRHHP